MGYKYNTGIQKLLNGCLDNPRYAAAKALQAADQGL